MGQVARIVMVRHGQTELNRANCFRGRIDVPLNEAGLRQARQTGLAVRERHDVAAVYSSPLRRAMQTAEAIGEAAGVAARAHPGLLDFSYGEWEGRHFEEVQRAYPDQYQLYLVAPHRARIPGGESLRTFRRRVAAAAESIAAAHPSETVVLVGHWMVCRVLACHFLGLGNAGLPRVFLDNASISLFERRRGGWTAMLLNDTCHLRVSDE